MSEDNLHHMATAIEALKKIAPTHPHPGNISLSSLLSLSPLYYFLFILMFLFS
jgi:hypothetical protein